MSIAGIALIASASLTTFMTSAEATQTALGVAKSCTATGAVQHPTALVLACGRHASTAKKLTWKKWGSAKTTGQGRLTVNGHTYPVRIVLDHPSTYQTKIVLGDLGDAAFGRRYAKATVTFIGVGVPKARHIDLPAPVATVVNPTVVSAPTPTISATPSPSTTVQLPSPPTFPTSATPCADGWGVTPAGEGSAEMWVADAAETTFGRTTVTVDIALTSDTFDYEPAWRLEVDGQYYAPTEYSDRLPVLAAGTLKGRSVSTSNGSVTAYVTNVTFLLTVPFGTVVDLEYHYVDYPTATSRVCDLVGTT